MINSFRKIVGGDIEHIVWGGLPTAYGGDNSYREDQNINHKIFWNFKEVEKHNFTKKYNIIYKNEGLQHSGDFVGSKWENTMALDRILSQHRDKFFLIVDHGNFDSSIRIKHTHCQIWQRKYFTPFYGHTPTGPRTQKTISKHRKHWFCSVLGRNCVFRSRMFDWIVDNNLHLSNKVSYLAFSEHNPRNLNDDKQNHRAENIQSRHKHLIPYNNFETKNTIPVDNDGRIKKRMPLADCLFNLVVETFLVIDTAFHTEKSLNTILYGHIPVILGGSGSMRKLQDFGIIIPDYIKWSIWDEIPADQVNFSKIHILQRQLLKFFEDNSLDEIADDWYPYALRNLRTFNSLEENCLAEEKEICRWLMIATQNITRPEWQKLYQ